MNLARLSFWLSASVFLYVFTNSYLYLGLFSGNEEKFRRSNIVPNQLTYDFLAFKTLTRLKLTKVQVSPDKIGTFGMLRKTLVHFTANQCSLASVRDLLFGDTYSSDDQQPVEAKTNETGSAKQVWNALQFLDLRQNEISSIDESINACAPHLRTLLLGYNQITHLENLDRLTELCTLELTANKMDDVTDMHTKLGQILRLDISHNRKVE